MNIDDFKKGIELLQINYGKKYTTEQLKLFYENLKDMSKEKFIANVKVNIKDNPFMPNIAQLRGETKQKDYIGYEQRDYSEIDFSKLYANNNGKQT